MHPLAELQKLLTPRPSQASGTVVATDSGTVSIATSKGIVVLQRRDATDYRKGDIALLNGKELAGRVKDDADIPIFFV